MSLDVSPTFSSGDHFAPLAKPKKLLSRRKTKEIWGFNAKSYGGIGVLLLNKNEIKNSKGLLVSRGHHHVGSGVHKFHPVSQPYQVTSLSKSACRPTDQLLPNVNDVDVIRISKESNLLSDKSEVRSCFKPIFDVFPSFDISQNDNTGNTDKTLNKRESLRAKTIQALREISKEIYKTTSHQRDFPKQGRAKAKRRMPKTLTFVTGHERSTPNRIMDTFHEVSTQPNEENRRCVVCACQISAKDFTERLTDVPICNFCKRTAIFRVSGSEDHSVGGALRLPNGSGRDLPMNSVGYRETNGSANNGLLKASKPPSNFTQIYSSPLNYLGYYRGRHRNRLSALIRESPTVGATSEDDGSDTTKHDGTTSNPRSAAKRMALKRIAIPISLKDKEILKQKGICCSDSFLLKEGRRYKATLKDVLPMIYFPLRNETDETTEAAEDAAKDGEETDRKLRQSPPAPAVIKTFKSRAHKRYLGKYLEDTPDTRESHIDAKKHFFSGYHASVFRG